MRDGFGSPTLTPVRVAQRADYLSGFRVECEVVGAEF
jgi:hypothetical protein